LTTKSEIGHTVTLQELKEDIEKHREEEQQQDDRPKLEALFSIQFLDVQ
jgi:hypothetical protein